MMHDPMVVAFEIRRPWPKVRKLNRPYKRKLVGAFWRFAGIELYWPALLTVWHVEPEGRDSGTVCPPSTWRKHPRHWKLQLHPLQHFRRWAFTRCAWCNGKSRRGDRVNTSMGWTESRKPAHWWQGEQGIFHGDCLSVERAHNTCVCLTSEGGPWSSGSVLSGPYGSCGTCGGYRRMASASTRDDYLVHQATNKMMRTIGKGQRDPAVMALVRQQWAEHRAKVGA